jgi:hypothetical protein
VSRGIKAYFRPETVVFLFFWLFLLLAGRDGYFRDPGSLWHIVVGEKILGQGELIHADSFSFTRAGSPWLAQWWLGECVLALLARLGGLDAIAVATATLVAGFFTWIYYRFRREGMDSLLSLLFAALTLLASAYHLHPRPHVVTILMIGWTFACLVDLEAGRITLGRLYWLFPLYVLWANVHGGMVGGVASLVAAGAGWCAAEIVGRPSPLVGLRRKGVFAGLIVLCSLAALVNPYGLELPRVWSGLMTSPVLPRLIQEHGPLLGPNAASVAWIVFLMVGVYGLFLAGVPFRSWRVTWLLPLVWLFLTWTRIRYGPLFAVTAGLVLADAFPHVRWAAWLARHGSAVFRLRPTPAGPGWRGLILPAGLVAAALGFQAAAVPVPVLGMGWARLDPFCQPVELLPELRAYEKSHPDGTPIFNDMLFGGFLIYHVPGLRVFIDDRCELYGDDGLLAYAHAYFEDPAQVERWRQQYGFEAALVQTGSAFDRYLRGAPGWTSAGQSGPASFYRRIAP